MHPFRCSTLPQVKQGAPSDELAMSGVRRLAFRTIYQRQTVTQGYEQDGEIDADRVLGDHLRIQAREAAYASQAWRKRLAVAKEIDCIQTLEPRLEIARGWCLHREPRWDSMLYGSSPGLMIAAVHRGLEKCRRVSNTCFLLMKMDSMGYHATVAQTGLRPTCTSLATAHWCFWYLSAAGCGHEQTRLLRKEAGYASGLQHYDPHACL